MTFKLHRIAEEQAERQAKGDLSGETEVGSVTEDSEDEGPVGAVTDQCLEAENPSEGGQAHGGIWGKAPSDFKRPLS